MSGLMVCAPRLNVRAVGSALLCVFCICLCMFLFCVTIRFLCKNGEWANECEAEAAGAGLENRERLR